MRERLIVTLIAATAWMAPVPSRAEESSRQIICGLIDRAADAHSLPSSFLTRLIWRESSFRSEARSHVGAQGIAQFMPATAAERGLADPFDPAAAIPASASYLSELEERFGSLPLAAAAYNAGPNRVARWQARGGALPEETLAHVRFITGATLDATGSMGSEPSTDDAGDCLATLASLKIAAPAEANLGLAAATAPWGVQLIAGPSKDRALKDYQVLQRRFGSVLGDQQPTILTTRLGGRIPRYYYRIRVAFEQRSAADALCRRLRAAGGLCLSTRN